MLHLVHRHDKRPSEAQEVSLASEGEQITDTILDKEAFKGENEGELSWLEE